MSSGSTHPPGQQTIGNHYVPRHYLKAWSADSARVWAYQIVVPRATVPLWKLRPIRGLAMQAHLYTSVLGGTESDAFEVWMNAEIEQPAIEAIDRVRSDLALKPHHWRRLAIYAAALDQRTPAAYLEHMRQYERHARATLDSVLAELRTRLEAGEKFGLPPDGPSHRDLRPGDLPLLVWREEDPTTGTLALKVELTIGRELWLNGLRHLLQATAKMLTQHRWIILRPPTGTEWFTSDHPVIRLNYYGPGHYDFGGGWGNKGSEIILPLSPEHLLYTRIGDRRFRHHRATVELAEHIRRFQAQRAHRWIFARSADAGIPALRPRQEDLPQFTAERDEWARWHTQQADALRPKDA